jgi:hypothetical protein
LFDFALFNHPPQVRCTAGKFHHGTAKRKRECNIIQNSIAHLLNNLEVSALVSIRLQIDSRRRIAWRMAATLVDFSWGATMRIDLFHIRSLKIVSSLAFCLALPAPSHAFTQDDQRRLCTGDVFRLCASEIPDRARITACMRRQRASLSQGCRSVFGKPSDLSASTRRSVRH